MLTHQNFVLHIRELIGNGKLKQALTELNTWAEGNADEDTQQTITLHLASYTNNERSNSMNFIARDEYLRETTRITYAVLTLLNDLQPIPKKRNKSTSEPTSTNAVRNFYNIGSINDANFGTSIHDSKNVNTGNISAGGNVVIGSSNNSVPSNTSSDTNSKIKKKSIFIAIAVAITGFVGFVANIGGIKETFFKKEDPKVLAAPPVNYKNEELIPLDTIKARRYKTLKTYKEDGLLPLDSVIARAERKKQEAPKILKGLNINNMPKIKVGRDVNGTIINNGTTTNNYGTKKD